MIKKKYRKLVAVSNSPYYKSNDENEKINRIEQADQIKNIFKRIRDKTGGSSTKITKNGHKRIPMFFGISPR